MAEFSHLAPAFEKQLLPKVLPPDGQQAASDDQRLAISVVFTSPEGALVALQRAAVFAARLSARITLVVPQIVPFPLPLSSPPVLLDFQEARLREIASECPVETVVRIYLCRDRWDVLGAVLLPHSLVVVGTRRKWRWFGLENRVARGLRKAGYEVVMAD